MKKLGVQVNDLFSVAENLGESFRSDWVHYNEEGCRLLADAVVTAMEL